MRSDLPRGDLCAQITHAAGETGGNLPPETHAVVLGVPDSDALEALSERLMALGIEHRVIREPDPPYLGQATAIGLMPTDRKSVRRALSSIGLLR